MHTFYGSRYQAVECDESRSHLVAQSAQCGDALVIYKSLDRDIAWALCSIGSDGMDEMV